MSARAAPDVDQLARGVLSGEPRGVAQAISLVEDRRAEMQPAIIELLGRLARGRARDFGHRVGITGPPGAGKSSLVSLLARELRRRGSSVGVLAVDPSSPRSGGALLGDRARIVVDPDDAAMFVRSMASGGDLGGLARAAGAAVDVLSAAYESVLIETTGVGQSETDVEHVADTVVLVIQPASGDMLQFIKAGILEIPHVLVVNKSDLGAVAERALAELSAALGVTHLGAHPAWQPLVVSTSAETGLGIAELCDACATHRAQLVERGLLESSRLDAHSAWALRLFTKRHGELALERVGGARAAAARLRALVEAGATAIEAATALAAE